MDITLREESTSSKYIELVRSLLSVQYFKMFGRKGAVKQDELWDVFLSFENDIIEDDRVVVTKSEIWKKINEMFPISNPKALYTAVLRWHNAQNKKQDISEVICHQFDEISMEESEDALLHLIQQYP